MVGSIQPVPFFELTSDMAGTRKHTVPRLRCRLRNCAVWDCDLSEQQQLMLLYILERKVTLGDRRVPLITEDDSHIGCFKYWSLAVDTEDPTPIHCGIRPNPEWVHHMMSEDSGARGMVGIHVALMRCRMIVPTISAWMAEAAMVSDDGRDWELVLNYRPLNRQLCVPEPFSGLARGEADYEGARRWSLLGVHRGAHQILIRPDTRDKMAFGSPLGQFTWRTVPNAMAGSQDVLAYALADALEGLEGCTVIRGRYILVHSPSVDRHLIDLYRVTSRLIEAQITLNASCSDVARSSLQELQHTCAPSPPCEMCTELKRCRWVVTCPYSPERRYGCSIA